MSTIRMAAVAATLTCALLLGGAGTAAAQSDGGSLTRVVDVTGKAENGKRFRGTYTIQRFIRRNGKVRSVGTLRGSLKGRQIVRRGVRMPVRLGNTAQAAQLPPLPNGCTILDLSIQPINLNLLGLVVRTSRIDLRIDAVRGPGNLLGNLLCALTGLLDPGTLGGATGGQLTAILNALLQLVPRTA